MRNTAQWSRKEILHCMLVAEVVHWLVVDHLTMLTRHLEKQLEESRTEVETLRRRVELLSDESQRIARDKAAMVQTLSRKVRLKSFRLFDVLMLGFPLMVEIPEFEVGILQIWNVVENDPCAGKSYKSYGVNHCGHFCTTSQNKTPAQSFCDNFDKYEPILIIVSRLHLEMNRGRRYYIICHLTLNLLLNYLAKFECSSIQLYRIII